MSQFLGSLVSSFVMPFLNLKYLQPAVSPDRWGNEEFEPSKSRSCLGAEWERVLMTDVCPGPEVTALHFGDSIVSVLGRFKFLTSIPMWRKGVTVWSAGFHAVRPCLSPFVDFTSYPHLPCGFANSFRPDSDRRSTHGFHAAEVSSSNLYSRLSINKCCQYMMQCLSVHLFAAFPLNSGLGVGSRVRFSAYLNQLWFQIQFRLQHLLESAPIL